MFALLIFFWYNKVMEQKDKDIKLKCASCGASLNLEDKKCSYCGTINPNRKLKEIKELTPPKAVGKQKSMFGGLLAMFLRIF